MWEFWGEYPKFVSPCPFIFFFWVAYGENLGNKLLGTMVIVKLPELGEILGLKGSLKFRTLHQVNRSTL